MSRLATGTPLTVGEARALLLRGARAWVACPLYEADTGPNSRARRLQLDADDLIGWLEARCSDDSTLLRCDETGDLILPLA